MGKTGRNLEILLNEFLSSLSHESSTQYFGVNHPTIVVGDCENEAHPKLGGAFYTIIKR